MGRQESDHGVARKNIVQALDNLFRVRRILDKQSTEWNSVLKAEYVLYKVLQAIEEKGSPGRCASSSWATFNPTGSSNADRPAT